MYGCERWTMKKTEHRRIDASELWCWRRLLRVPWTTRRSNHSILKKISPEYSLKGLKLKLKLQDSDHLMWRSDSFEKTLMLEKIEGKTGRGWERMRWLDGITDNGQEGLECCSLWSRKELDMTERLNWTELKDYWKNCDLQFSSVAQLCVTLSDLRGL